MFKSDPVRRPSATDRTTLAPARDARAAAPRRTAEPGWFESSFELAHGLEVVEADGAELLSLFDPARAH